MNILRKHWPVFMLVIVILVYFLPCLMYVSDRSGLNIVNAKKTLGVTIKFNNNWYPLISSDMLLGKLIISSKMPKTVIYCENSWINPWGCDQIWVSQYPAHHDDMIQSGKFASVQQYPWGAVGIVKDEVTKTPNRKLGLIQGIGIGFSGVNLNILNGIDAINIDNEKPLVPN